MKKTESERLKNVLKRKAKLHSQRQKTIKKKNDVPKTPINDTMLTIREMKPNDKLNIQRMLSDFRRDYYISVYKGIFRSWFAYALTAGLLAISLTFLRSNLWAVCAPPILVTILLLWRVNRYKSYNQTFTVHDMELLCESETPYYKFKSTESRRINQGVLVAFVQEKKRPRIDEMELAELNESDIDELDDSELEEVLAGREINLVGYLIYGKQKDELETVAIKEICIDSDYRKRHVATYFLKKASRLLHDFGYRRFAFQASTFNTDLLSICEKKPNLITKIYTWTAYQFLPGVFDNRTVYSIDFKQLNKLFN